MNCRNVEENMMDLLEPGASNTAVSEHIAGCANCKTQFTELRQTFAALDMWSAPEPSAWFDQKLSARLRDEATREPEGFFERMRAHFLFNTGHSWKPALSGALAVALLAVGGTATFQRLHPVQAAASVTVQDLQRLDNNETALQQMDQLIDDANDDTDSPS